MDMSARQSEVQRPAFAVDCGMDFCGSAATADADRLIFLPPFARDFDANWSKTRFQMRWRDQRLHAQTEEQVAYPTALLIGRYVKSKLAA